MKKFNLFHILTMFVLVVVLASCGFTQPGYGDEQYPDRTVRSRSIYADPYYGTTQIVRDPYTGRYYEVTPVSPYGYDTYSSPYGTYGNSRYYGRTNSRRYSNNNYPRRTQPSQTQQQPRENSQTINKAKSIIRKD
jgi:hypothetical protein